MKLDDMIKGVFENEVERYRADTPPLSMPATRPAARQHIGKKRAYNPLADIAAFLLVIAFCVMTGPLKNDPRLRSPIAGQGENIAWLIPENPIAAVCDFLYVRYSSYEE
jgi:hypothetical protein